MIWPRSENVTHINYHYTQFGEIVDYLNSVTENQVIALDCDIETNDITDIIEKNSVSKIIMNVNYENAMNAFKMAQEIKKRYKAISMMAYGNLTVMFPELFINSDFDAIYRDGDFETCIESFINNYEKEVQGTELEGMYLVKENSLIETRKGSFIKGSEWGMSKEGQVPVDEYNKRKGKNRYVINISRGCPFGCPHCLIQLTEGKKERRRDLDNLEKVIDKIKNKYKHIKIWAANFTLDKEYVIEFCKMMKEKFPDITWECATRIDLVRDEEMLEKMYEAGCRQISLGIESLNNEELIHTKKFKREQVLNAILNIQHAGINVKGCIMLGMPNQTKQSIIETLEFLVNNNVSIRPTNYTPYHTMSKDVDIRELCNYNRKTLENNNVSGVSAAQLLKLVRSPYEYRSILNIENDKTKRELNSREESLGPREILDLTKMAIMTRPGYVSKQLEIIKREIDSNSKGEKEK